VLTQNKTQHRHQELLNFLRQIDKNVPGDLEVHIVLDNYSTHKHAAVKGSFARQERFHLHFTPTYSSWLNQVERWFGIITQRAIRRGSFRSVKELVQKTDQFVATYNENAMPFMWHATAESILEKLGPLCQSIPGTGHWVSGSRCPPTRGIVKQKKLVRHSAHYQKVFEKVPPIKYTGCRRVLPSRPSTKTMRLPLP
jgi:putative transposase